MDIVGEINHAWIWGIFCLGKDFLWTLGTITGFGQLFSQSIILLQEIIDELFMLITWFLSCLSIFGFLNLHFLFFGQELFVILVLERFLIDDSDLVFSDGPFLIHPFLSWLGWLIGVATKTLVLGLWLLSHLVIYFICLNGFNQIIFIKDLSYNTYRRNNIEIDHCLILTLF